MIAKPNQQPGWQHNTEFETASNLLDAKHQEVITFLSAYDEPFKQSNHFRVFTSSIKSGNFNSGIQVSEV